MTAGVAMLSLYCWLIGLKQQVDQFGSSSLPAALAIVTDKVRLWPPGPHHPPPSFAGHLWAAYSCLALCQSWCCFPGKMSFLVSQFGFLEVPCVL